MKKISYILVYIFCLTSILGCQLNLWPDTDVADEVRIERYDRVQSRFLTTGDYSALQQMNTLYPMETRTLIENMLEIGNVDQEDINERLLKFYQDPTLQNIISEVGKQYAMMDDIKEEMASAFAFLHEELPEFEIPKIYTQIGALGQSIIIGDNNIGICLDKYLGADYSVYKKYYTPSQTRAMTRENIVPDCLLFYLISLYPLDNFETSPQKVRDAHIGKVMYVANKALGKSFFDTPDVHRFAEFHKKHPDYTLRKILEQ
ncbi:MAG: gliding motility protein GldB [Prevotella sp.]|nr:gliding motility protein GldB [Prevotella sp.]MBQ9093860.1 gliding motility protein GldB [Prevotella sp.]